MASHGSGGRTRGHGYVPAGLLPLREAIDFLLQALLFRPNIDQSLNGYQQFHAADQCCGAGWSHLAAFQPGDGG